MPLPVLLKDRAITEEMLSIAREIVDSQRTLESRGSAAIQAQLTQSTKHFVSSQATADLSAGMSSPSGRINQT